jgi:OOP family OmpA-OmpF porin
MNKLLTITLLLIVFESHGQNLVPNPSFEDTITCPWTFDGINGGISNYWFSPTIGTSDLIHQCSSPIIESYLGFQTPNSGLAYAGFFSYLEQQLYREYISAKLLTTLEAGQLYYFRMFISRADSTNYASNIGVYFGPDSINLEINTNLNLTPQIETSNTIIDHLEWTCVVGNFIAIGNEKYITIGNFRDDMASNIIYTGGGGMSDPEMPYSAYYYVDDIYLAILPTIDCNETNGVIEIPKIESPLKMIVDMMGIETEDKTNTLLIYIYEDGTTKKVFKAK